MIYLRRNIAFGKGDRLMIDFANIEKYRENNRIEAKKALGGLPKSIWETYSAFANTLGGVILLGVEEYRDTSLHTVDLPDPDRLASEFRALINDTKKVSVNILSENDVTVETVNGDRIVAIRVPRAHRSEKPVYIDGDPIHGTYRRNGEGDYRCTVDEVNAMMRDASVKTHDMTVLDGVGLDSLDIDAVHGYRERLITCRLGHAWQELDDREFLRKLGAVGVGDDGVLCPTGAGLLMFGRKGEIVKEYPEYLLEYCEQTADGSYITVLSSDEQCGNVCDFYFKVCDMISDDTKPAAVYSALCEALANCLINADYSGSGGVVVVKGVAGIDFSNPGGFRIDVESAKSGGVSDPRNGALVKMFNLIDIGKRVGSGIPNIFSVWKKQGWKVPVITESFDPDRITLTLEFSKANNDNISLNAENENKIPKAHFFEDAIISYLTDNISATCSDIAVLLGVGIDEARSVLDAMISNGVTVLFEENGKISYRLAR